LKLLELLFVEDGLGSPPLTGGRGLKQLRRLRLWQQHESPPLTGGRGLKLSGWGESGLVDGRPLSRGGAD